MSIFQFFLIKKIKKTGRDYLQRKYKTVKLSLSTRCTQVSSLILTKKSDHFAIVFNSVEDKFKISNEFLLNET